LREWATNALLPAYVVRKGPSVHLLVIAVLVGTLVFCLGLLLAVVTWIAAFLGIAVSVISHLALGRPFLIEARSSHGAWAAWWVPGWRSARRVRDQVRRHVEAGADLQRVTIDGASRYESASQPTGDG
jgi:hypothetical protein